MSSEVTHKPTPGWQGECPVCHGQLMRVTKRALAGGDPLLASISLSGIALALVIGIVGKHWGGPVALIVGFLSLLTGLQHRTRWQCRRCRASYSKLEGADDSSLKAS